MIDLCHCSAFDVVVLCVYYAWLVFLCFFILSVTLSLSFLHVRLLRALIKISLSVNHIHVYCVASFQHFNETGFVYVCVRKSTE